MIWVPEFWIKLKQGSSPPQCRQPCTGAWVPAQHLVPARGSSSQRAFPCCHSLQVPERGHSAARAGQLLHWHTLNHKQGTQTPWGCIQLAPHPGGTQSRPTISLPPPGSKTCTTSSAVQKHGKPWADNLEPSPALKQAAIK